MDLGFLLNSMIPSQESDGTRLHYRCNGWLALSLFSALLGIGAQINFVSVTVIADRGLGLLSAACIFSVLATLLLYTTGCRSRSKGSSLKPYFSGNLVVDRWFGVQLNPQFLGIDLKFFFVRAGMMGWLLINLSVLAKSMQDGTLSQSMILYQLFCGRYILDYFIYEEYMTSMWDIIAERLGFMLVFGDLVWIPFTFSIQSIVNIRKWAKSISHFKLFSSKEIQPICWYQVWVNAAWWLLHNKVKLKTATVIANSIVFLVGYMVFTGANKQKHDFKKNPKAH